MRKKLSEEFMSFCKDYCKKYISKDRQKDILDEIKKLEGMETSEYARGYRDAAIGRESAESESI